jgi:hypothetical protein
MLTKQMYLYNVIAIRMKNKVIGICDLILIDCMGEEAIGL